MTQTELGPFWREVDRLVSLAGRYHDFELTQQHTCGDMRDYQARYVQLRISASSEGALIRAGYWFAYRIPAPRCDCQIIWDGEIREGRFTFSDEDAVPGFLRVFRLWLFFEATLRVTNPRGLLLTNESDALPMHKSVLYRSKWPLFPKLRIDFSIPEDDSLLLTVHFIESYVLFETPDAPRVTPPLSFSKASGFTRFVEEAWENPRLISPAVGTIDFGLLLRYF